MNQLVGRPRDAETDTVLLTAAQDPVPCQGFSVLTARAGMAHLAFHRGFPWVPALFPTLRYRAP